MKTKLTLTLLLGLLTIAFIFTGETSKIAHVTSPPVPVNNNLSDSFLIGAMDNGQDAGFNYIADTLGFNLWHKYVGDTLIGTKRYPTGWVRNGAPGDNLFAGYNDYVSQVQNVLDNVNSHNMKALMNRPKIEYLCYGQRSDYQCEPVSTNDDYWFYSFNDHNTGVPDTDSGKGVIHCRTMPTNPSADSPGFVVKRLKANAEQCNNTHQGDNYRWDYQCEWLIKPRIRIDSAYANNPSNLNKEVCKLIVLGQNRDTLKKSVIRVINFSAQGYYDGRYLEEFYNLSSVDSLKIHGPWLGTDTVGWWGFSARGTRTIQQENENLNHADIQVYWYGNCDIWIDYVRVDNDIADGLFKGQYDNTWLKWEAQGIANHGSSPLEFYIELLEFNQIPCIAEVNKKLQLYSGRQIGVMCEPLCYFQYQLPFTDRGVMDTPEKIKRMFMDSTNSREFFTGDPYPLTATRPVGCNDSPQYSRIPNTLLWTGGDSVMAITTSPSDYDAWLQSIFDTTCFWYSGGPYTEPKNPQQLLGVFMYLMKHGDAVSRVSNRPFIAMVQADQWLTSTEVEREPTTQELDLMTNLAVSYGARGIMLALALIAEQF